LQKNVLDRRVWATRQELRIAIVTWIERTYHRPGLGRVPGSGGWSGRDRLGCIAEQARAS
ncbi:hypothetical protein ACWDQL_37190, partial [Streptomyces olivaceus]